MTVYWCELAWLGGPEAEPGVVIEVDRGGICAVTSGHSTPPPGTTPLRGLTIPALANAHSHAFHRALRSRTQGKRGTFWTWRDLMYRVASGLDPDNYYRLARAVFAEMAMAGIGVVGEFHYVHHRPGGGAYDDPNAMGVSLAAAAADAGIRLTLLDTLYLHGGFAPGTASGYAPLSEEQARFSDGSAEAWADRGGRPVHRHLGPENRGGRGCPLGARRGPYVYQDRGALGCRKQHTAPRAPLRATRREPGVS